MSKPTIKDVALRADVSTGTVSNVLTGRRLVSRPVAERVHHAIELLGYSPNWMARGLRGVRTRTVGLVVPDNANPFFAEVSWSIEQVCTDAGMSLILCNTARSAERERCAIETLIDKRVDGIIIATGSDLAESATLLNGSVPVVVIDHDAGGFLADAVLVDHRRGGELAARHLVEQGHRQIACITGLPVQSNASRIAAFRAVLAHAGIDLPEERVHASDTHADGGYWITKQLLTDDPSITAVFAANDLVALGAIRALYDIGCSVPAAVSVIGYDDISLASHVVPRLTTVRQPIGEIGRRSIEILENRIDDLGRSPERWVLPVELVVRESTELPRSPPSSVGTEALSTVQETV